MSLARLLRRWLPFVVLVAVALGSWQTARAVDTDDASITPVRYDNGLGTPLISARRIPETLQAPVADDAVEPTISSFLGDLATAQPDGQSCLTIEVEGRELANSGANLALIPASNQKLLTTYAVLQTFDPTTRFTTRVSRSGAVVDGVLEGDLILVGGGDPFLVTDRWREQYDELDEQGAVITPDHERPWSRLEDLADDVAASGITAIDGVLIADESLFDTERQGPWAERLIVQNQSGPLSALSVNEGFVSWGADNPANSLRTKSDDPAANAARVFAELLVERGVSSGAIEVGTEPAGATTIASVESPTMAEMVTHVNSWSSNYGAEILLKHLGLELNGEGSTAAGAAALRAVLEANPAIDTQGLVVDDGSGLAETNRVTCAMLNDLLVVSGVDSLLASSLSIGGERGSLALRHVDTDADGNLLAKTGTLNSTTALSGFLISPIDDETVLTFSYLTNAELIGEPVIELQEPFIEDLTTYPDAPPTVELDPEDPVPRDPEPVPSDD